MLPISASEAATLSDAISRADVLLASAFGVSGNSWFIEATTGGDTTPATETLLGPFVVYVVNTRDYVISLSASEAEVPDAQWRFIAPQQLNPADPEGPTTNLPVDEGNVLRSATDGARFVVRSVATDGRNTVGICELL